MASPLPSSSAPANYSEARAALIAGEHSHVARVNRQEVGRRGEVIEAPAIRAASGVWYALHPQDGQMYGLISDRRGGYPVSPR